MPVALANHEINIVRELARIIEIKAPLPVVVAMTKFPRGPVGNTNLPDRPAISNRRPGQITKRNLAAFGDHKVGKRELAQNSIRYGVQRVPTGPHIVHSKAPALIAARPKLIKFRVPLPVDIRRHSRTIWTS